MAPLPMLARARGSPLSVQARWESGFSVLRGGLRPFYGAGRPQALAEFFQPALPAAWAPPGQPDDARVGLIHRGWRAQRVGAAGPSPQGDAGAAIGS